MSNLHLVVLAILFTVMNISCIGTQQEASIMENNYSIPFLAEGEHSGIYDNLIESKIDNPAVKEVVSHAKKIAISAGYKLTGKDLEIYSYNGREYPIKKLVFENSNYFVVQFIPEGVKRSSLDIEIVIEKDSGKVISILQGS